MVGTLTEVQGVGSEFEEPKYCEWRSTLGSWRSRADQRSANMEQLEAGQRGLEQRRVDAEERRELERTRAKESAAHAEQRLREASEHSRWKNAVMQERRSDERARVQEHEAQRKTMSTLRRGVASVTLASSVANCFHPPLPPGKGILKTHPVPVARATAVRNMGAGGFELVLCDDPTLAAPLQAYASLVTPASPRWALDDPAQQQLAEDEAWRAAVERNRRALRVNRDEKKAEVMRRDLEEERARAKADVRERFRAPLPERTISPRAALR